MWTIDYSLIEQWLDQQDTETVALIFAALEILQDEGPNLGRPLVDTVKGSGLKNMKELRPASAGESEIRILFAFDPSRQAVMLLAGDKARGRNSRAKWSGWYKKAIPEAEKIYAKYLRAKGGRNARAE